MFSLVVFDLDGTLADSFPWFLSVVNGVAGEYGFRPIADADIELLRRAGSREILRRLDVPLWKLPAIARRMRTLKQEQIERIPLFAGVHEMLQSLADARITLALVSSDSEANARRQLGAACAHFSHFACGASLFGKAAKFKRVLRETRVAPAHAIAIGDEVRDIEAARAAGIACGAVMWGYAAREALEAHAPDMIFERVEDIAGQLRARPAFG